MPDLERYRQKRDFSRTPEPPPGAADDSERNLVFVVQQHAARRMHWDFRLEVDGVLKSWPLPRGPSLNPKDRRMAVMVEDHPYDYRGFEGLIPKGQYGAGQVIVWDEGTYSPDEGGVTSWNDKDEGSRRMLEAIAAGKVSFTLRGHKLKGSFALVKTRYGENDWLLIKHRDDHAAERDVLAEDRSVRSGLTIQDLKEGRMPAAADATPVMPPSARKAPFPDSKRERPMLATLIGGAFDRPGWLWEPKLDGIRALAYVRDGKAELRSRRGIDVTKQYPSLVRALQTLPGEAFVLDGEICALDEQGVPRFQLLQHRINLSREPDIARVEAESPAVYYVFDLLYLDGYDLRPVPLSERKRLLEARLGQDGAVRYVAHIEESGRDVEAGARRLGFEGVVGKRADSRYEPGARGKAWLKVKTVNQQEFVVGGFTRGEGARRSTFGALALGHYDDDGDLRYAGNVGSGFNDRDLAATKARLDALRRETSPFAGMADPALSWVRPQLVAAVKFAEWTRDDRLRAPVFLGLRDDVEPRQVRRETPATDTALDLDVPAAAAPHAGGVEREVEDLLAQLENPKHNFALQAGGESIKLTNLDKVFWPEYEGRRALLKRDLVRYYVEVAPFILPHLKDRPLTLTRYPNGIHGQLFYQKHYGQPVPAFVDTVDIWSGHNEADGTYIMCNNLATLVWLAQIADLELHAWMSRLDPEPDARGRSLDTAGSEASLDASVLDCPDYMIFDLDPYIYSGLEAQGAEPEFNRRGWEKTVEIALSLKEILDQLRFSSYVKTSGKTGIHVYVPILRQYGYDEVRAATQTIGRFMLQRHPKDLTMEWDTAKRRGKVFFDAGQNARGKTLAAQYSLRPTPWAGVSTPVLWSELAGADPTALSLGTVPARLAASGDPWADILSRKNDLRSLIEGG